MIEKFRGHNGEAELVAGLRRRDHEAFERFIAQYNDWLKHTARSILDNEQDAEEVVQEIFLRVWRGIEEFRGDARIIGWLTPIVRNIAVDFLRRRMKEQVLDSASAEELFSHGLWGTRPDVLLERQETSVLVRRYMDDLRDEYQGILILRHFEDMDLKEIAQRLSISDVNARVREHRARGALKKNLEEI